MLLSGGWTLAAARQPHGYDAVRDTISALAARGATDRWVMTAALAGLGACHVITATGLRPAHGAGRMVLAFGRCSDCLGRGVPEPSQGSSEAHPEAASLALTSLAIWPAFAVRRVPGALLLTPTACVAATAVLLGLRRGSRSNSAEGRPVQPSAQRPAPRRSGRSLSSSAPDGVLARSRWGAHRCRVPRRR